MPRSLPLSRRLATAARWPLGVLITGWDYLWRTTPMHRSEDRGAVPDDMPPPLPPATDRSDMQGVEDGVGPLMHRRFTTRVCDAELDAESLIGAFAGDPDCATPTALAKFIKLRGDEGELRVGDEFTVRMPGPWDGPVRAIEVEPASFDFVTLDGHLEAGRIRFGARDLGPGRLEICIEAWARGGDRLSSLLFDRLPLNKEVQLHMWTSVLERLSELSGGRRDGAVDITTRRIDADELAHADERLAATARARRALAALSDRPLNFDPAELRDASPDDGWHIDDYEQALAPEPPGDPVPGGSFEVAQRLMRDYAFADPAMVHAVYDPTGELAQRNMLLQVRFGPLRMFFGCRVGTITDEMQTIDERRVRVWGWSYGTLAGHVERGQMDYRVRKWLDDGTVEFRIHVVSRRAKVRNPIIRLGFRLVGRGQQTRFARRACERMGELVARELGRDGGGGGGGGSALADERGATQLRGEGGVPAQQRGVRDGDEGHLATAHPEQHAP